MEPIVLQCNFYKAQTLVDGGWRVSLDTHEGMAKEVVEAAKLKGEALYAVIMTEAQFYAERGRKNGKA